MEGARRREPTARGAAGERSAIGPKPPGQARPAPWADIPDRRLVAACRAARRDKTLAVLEGFHLPKHALRLGADGQVVLTRGLEPLQHLCDMLAPAAWTAVGAQARAVAP